MADNDKSKTKKTLTRRDFLISSAAAGLGAAVGGKTLAQEQQTPPAPAAPAKHPPPRPLPSSRPPPWPPKSSASLSSAAANRGAS